MLWANLSILINYIDECEVNCIVEKLIWKSEMSYNCTRQNPCLKSNNAEVITIKRITIIAYMWKEWKSILIEEKKVSPILSLSR